MGKSSPAAPAAPDYTGAANATAAGNLAAAQQAQEASMVNQVTPYGNLTYNQTGTNSDGSPSYTATTSLTPSAQNTLDIQQGISNNLGNLTNQQLGLVNQTYSQPMDLSSVQDVANQAYSNYTSRLDPQWAQQGEMEQAQLANQGLTAGSEAYDNAMRDFNNAKNDAYTQASTAAINTMPQTYQLALSQYEQPLNQLNALRTGAQITNPTFANTPQQQTTAGSNLSGAAAATGTYNQGLYNAQTASNNAFTSGLFGLGSAGLTAML